ncbi:hypothetical protein Bca4012_053889 [Brassica carinata]
MSDAESSLLMPADRADKVTCMDLRDGSFTEELKRLIYFAAPMAAVVIAQFTLQIISMVMVGHLGNLALASAALASSFCNIGLSYALDTLSGQAYGAKLYRKLGVQTYTAMFCLTLVCIPISIIWFNMEKLLVFLGQDQAIAHEAGRYAAWLIPGMFSYAVTQPLTRYFQNQSMIKPLLVTSCLVFCLHVPLCWLLVYKSGLGFLGGAVAMCLSSWLSAVLLGSVMFFSSACSETRAPFSMEIFSGVGEFFRYALPSAAMVCLQTIATVSAIPIAIAAAASTRISNELGAGNSRAAHIVVYTAMFLAVMESVVVSMSLLVGRSVFGYVFSSDERTVDYVAKMAPLVSVSIILDGLQGVLAATLAFWVNLKGVGLWIGIQAGALLQNFLLGLFTGLTNWQNQAFEARKRMALA